MQQACQFEVGHRPANSGHNDHAAHLRSRTFGPIGTPIPNRNPASEASTGRPHGQLQNSAFDLGAPIGDNWGQYRNPNDTNRLKSMLFEDLYTKHVVLEQRYKQLLAKMSEQESGGASLTADRESQLQANIEKLTALLNHNGFIVVLVDGNNLWFQDRYIRAGREGGILAAETMIRIVHTWAITNVRDCPRDVKIVVRFFADVKSLASACYNAGLASSPSNVEDFLGGFNSSDALFDVIDTGVGQELTAFKMIASLRLYIYNYHCRQIVFGDAQDIVYARELEHYRTSTEAKSRITLIQHTSFDKPANGVSFQRIPLSTLLHTPRLDFSGSHAMRSSSHSRYDTSITENCTGTGRSEGSTLRSGLAPTRGISISPSITSTEESSRTSSDSTNWNKVASRAAALPFKDLTLRPAPLVKPKVPHIMRNKHDQRIDEPMDYDHDQVSQLKKKKYCNQHYIGRGCCHWAASNGACPHRHEDKLSKDDLKWLRVVARETMCKRGTGCEEIDCIYGHHCPYLKQSGGVRCVNGSNCRFAPEMHGMDTKVAKYLTAASLRK